jgi:outer membrane cobalamin receptor
MQPQKRISEQQLGDAAPAAPPTILQHQWPNTLFLGAALVFFILFSGLTAYAEEFKPPEEMFKETRYTEESYYRTERMLLSATKNLMDSRTAPAINSVITAAEIRNMGARNLFDVLDKIPGFSTSWNQIKGVIDVRGVQTDHAEKVLLMIDGVRIRDSYTGSPTYFFGEDLMVENIKRIEVVRGPGSALYGANAFIGVINIITKDPEDYGDDQVVASAAAGSFNTRQYNLLFSHNKSDLKISGHLNYLDTDGERPVIEEDALSNSPVYNTSASLAPGRAQGFDEKLDMGLKLKYKDFSLNGRIINKERGLFAGTLGVLNTDSKLDVSMGLADLNYHRKISDDFDLAGKLYFVHMDYDAYSELYPPGFTGGNDVGLIGNPSFKNDVIGTELTTNYSPGDHLITSGMVYEQDRQYDVRHINNFADPFGGPVDVSETGNFNKDVTRKIWAAYVQDLWEMTAYDTLTLGVRYDHYNDFGGTTNPRAGYVHQFENEIVAKLLYGRAFRAPNNNELYSINNPAVVGNPDLKPETIETYEASVEIPFLRYFNINTSYFHNVIDDVIRLDFSQPSPYPFVNASGESTVDGIETELKCNFGKNRYGYLNASYQDSEDDQGRDLPYVADWMGNVGYNHEFFGKLNTNVNVHWIGERTRAQGDTRDKAPSATLVDVTLILKNFYKKFEIKGSAFNIFDDNYVAPSTITSITNDLPLHKRMFLVEVQYKF